MDNLANAYRATGKLDLALPLFEETVKLHKTKLGANHPATLNAMNGLAVADWQQKQLDKSIPLFEETLKRRKAKLGREHPDTLRTVGNLGVNYLKDAGRIAEAIPLLEEVDRAAKKYSQLRWVRGQLIDAYAKAGENAKLANLLLEQLPETGKRCPRTAHNWPAYSPISAWPSWSRKMGRGRAAPPRVSGYPREDAGRLLDDVQHEVDAGWGSSGQKKYAEAEPHLLAGYEGMKKREKTIPPQGNIRIREAIDRLVQLYATTGKKDDATKWRLELVKYPRGRTGAERKEVNLPIYQPKGFTEVNLAIWNG